MYGRYCEVLYGLIWYGIVYGMAWNDMYGKVLYGIVWYGIVLYSMIQYNIVYGMGRYVW